jgi:hypothetical protein
MHNLKAGKCKAWPEELIVSIELKKQISCEQEIAR